MRVFLVSSILILGCGRSSDGVGRAPSNETGTPMTCAVSSDTAPRVVGGAVAPEVSSTGIVYIKNCTASRVGPRELLLAAHCVVDATSTQLTVAPGDELDFVSAPDLKGQALDLEADGGPARFLCLIRKGIVDEVVAHPSYASELKSAPQDFFGTHVVVHQSSADVAVIRFRDPLDSSIKTRRVAGHAPSVGDPVTITGFGCETHDDSKPKRFTLKKAASKVIGQDVLASLSEKFEAGVAGFTDPACAPGSCLFLPGLETGILNGASNAGDICEGDSGGPVFASDDPDAAIVAVNSRGRFFSPTDKRELYGMVARVDDASTHAVGQWLRDLGIAVTN